MPPVLTHGDLATGNVLATPGGRAALVDPAASFGWAEIDVSMIYCWRGDVVPERYFAAYEEASPLDPGWRDRALLIHLRELLSLLAHFPDRTSMIRSVMPLIEEVVRIYK